MSNAKGCVLAVSTVIAAFLVMVIASIALNSGNTWSDPPRTANVPNHGPITGKWKRPDSSYTVKEGDTLSRIADAHGTTVASLIEANGLANADVIEVGQRLVINGAALQPSATATPKPESGPPRSPKRTADQRRADEAQFLARRAAAAATNPCSYEYADLYFTGRGARWTLWSDRYHGFLPLQGSGFRPMMAELDVIRQRTGTRRISWPNFATWTGLCRR